MNAIVSHIEPWLTDKGFKPDGTTFRRFSEAGDCLVVEFQSARPRNPESFRFYVNAGLVLNHWQAFKAAYENRSPYVPQIDDSQIWTRLRDPDATHFKDDWQVEIGQEATADNILKKIIGALEPIIATFRSYFDHAVLLAHLRRGTVDAVMVDKKMALSLLLMESGQGDELRELIEPKRERGALQSALADWIWATASDQQSKVEPE